MELNKFDDASLYCLSALNQNHPRILLSLSPFVPILISALKFHDSYFLEKAGAAYGVVLHKDSTNLTSYAPKKPVNSFAINRTSH